MGQPGLNEFTKQYFPQIRKKALIVDVRGNGGGFVSPLVIERLRRALVMVEMSRNGTPQTNPPQTFLGPMVTLMDEFSASDGDIFPYRFKMMGLGKLIGKRSWGGVVGIRDPLPLLMAATSSSPSLRLTRRKARAGSLKVTASIPILWSTTIRRRNSAAKTSSSTGRSRKFTRR